MSTLREEIGFEEREMRKKSKKNGNM